MPNYTFPGVPEDKLFDHVVGQAKAAEAAGFDLVTVMDHFYQIRGVGPETAPMLEAYSALAALATQTRKVKLGTLVTGVTYRNPALVAKEVTTLDVISKGRAILGIGAAWNEDEHVGYGFDYPPIARRMDRLAEAVTIAKLLFTEERPSFEGKFYRIDRALNVPRPIQKGGPKILIGGGGEKRTLRILAENDTQARAIMDALPPERRAMVRVVSSVDEATEFLRPYLDAGFGGFTFNNPTLPTVEAIGRAGEVIRALRGSSVAA